MLLLLLLLGTRSASAAAGHTHKPEGPETPQCEQVFLGDDIGYANIFEYHEEVGWRRPRGTNGPDDAGQPGESYDTPAATCQISMSELAAVCTGDRLASCLAFLEAEPQCDPVCMAYLQQVAATGDDSC